jgi:hypothetical protein
MKEDASAAPGPSPAINPLASLVPTAVPFSAAMVKSQKPLFSPLPAAEENQQCQQDT